MENLLNRSKQKFIKKESETNFRQLCIKMSAKKFTKDVETLTKGMKLIGKNRKNLLKKYFIQWTIFYY